jgi:glycosyltransferase involved in cell wall biosynthesis
MKFSILVATYNQEKYIQETINSCVSQDFEDYEILISDDCSTDKTWDIIQNNSNNKVRKFRQAKNLGEYNNRNFLIQNSIGDYIIFIDGEDIIYPYALSFISYFICRYPDAKILLARSWDEYYTYPFFVNNRIYALNQFVGLGLDALNFTNIVFNRTAILSIGAFDNPSIRIGDSYIQLKMGLKHGVLLIPEGFSWWRRISGQASESILNDQFISFQEINQFIPQIIKDTPLLSASEKRTALCYFYGNILRYCLKKIFSFKIFKTIKYLINYKIPLSYYFSLFVIPKRVKY